MNNGKMLIGWAETSITPDRKVGLAGQFAERVSEHVEAPVTVTAMAVECAGEQAVICSCDLVSVTGNLLRRIRELLPERATGLDPRKVIVAATHTHTSLDYRREGRASSSATALDILARYLPRDRHYVKQAEITEEVMGPDEALDFLAERIAAAIAEAWRGRQPAAIANAFGRAVVGHCRRVVFSDGSARMWGDTNQAVFEELEGGNDSGVELLYVFDAARKLTGVMANIACPAQCVQHRRFVSPDFWGETKRLLREKFGQDLFVMGLCGAAGDQCPVDLIRWVEPETPLNDPNIRRERPITRQADPSMFDIAGMRKTGQRIAREIIDAYVEAAAAPLDDTVLMHRVETLGLPVRRVTIAEHDTAVRAIEEFARTAQAEVNFNDYAKMHVHAGTIQRFEFQQDHDLHHIELHVLRLGNIAIATNPFELFLDYGNRIRARSLAAQTFIIQLACGADGYLPTRKAEQGGHYSAYVSSGITGHTGGDLLVRTTVERINALWREVAGVSG